MTAVLRQVSMTHTWCPFCTERPGGVSGRLEVLKPWVEVWSGKGQGWGWASPGPPDMGRGTMPELGQGRGCHTVTRMRGFNAAEGLVAGGFLGAEVTGSVVSIFVSADDPGAV